MTTKAPDARIGLLGLGAMGRQHLAGYAKIPGVEVFTRESERFRHCGSQDRESLYAAMISDPTLNALDLCLPTPLHARLTVAGLAAGKHVLCEKPMALHSSECDAMMHAAQTSGRVLMIAHVLRFAPPYKILKEAVHSFTYGALEHLELMRSSSFPQWAPWLSEPEQSGGAVLDLLVHDFDQAISIAGQPKQIHAQSLTSPDSVDCTLTYGQGLPLRSVRIMGGWYNDERPFSMGFRAKFEQGTLAFADNRIHLHRTGEPPVELRPRDVDMYTEQQRYFVDCVRFGRQPKLCPPAAAAQAVTLANSVKQRVMTDSAATNSAGKDPFNLAPEFLERTRT